MITLSILVCASAFLQLPSPCTSGRMQPFLPFFNEEPRPVDLAYYCLEIINEKRKLDGIPILMLHGLGVTKEMFSMISFNEVVARETGRKVCILDMRNHGESPWNNQLDIAAMTEDVKNFMNKILARKAIVLGSSLGGKIGVHLALNYPYRVEKLIVEDMRPNSFSPEGKAEVEFFQGLFIDLDKVFPQGKTEKEALKELLQILNDRLAKMNAPFRLDDPYPIPVKCSNGKCTWRTNPKVIHVVVNNIMEMWTNSSGRFKAPTLFVYGTESNFKVGEDKSDIKELFPNAELFPVKGAGHRVNIFPEAVKKVINFINQ